MNKESNSPREVTGIRTTISIATFIIILLGIALRVHGASGQLWLDEIWSINNLKDLTDPFKILGTLTSDNNHLLNSLWLYFLPSDAAPIALRAPSILFAVGALFLAYLIGRSRSSLFCFTFTAFVAFSYPLVVYSTEARGYGGLIFFLLLAYHQLEKHLKQQRVSSAIWLNIACIAGTLAHFSFLQALPAFLIWCLLFKKRSASVAAATLQTARLFLPALLATTALYAVHIRFISEGSGPLKSYLEVIINTLSVIVGGPEMSPVSPQRLFIPLGLAVLIGIIAITEIVRLKKEEHPRWALYLLGIFIVPLLTLLALQPRVIFIRYFLPAIVLLYLLLAEWLTRLLESPSPKRYLGTALTVCYLVFQSCILTTFVQVQRGDYGALTATMLQDAQQTPVSYSSDHDYRNPVLVKYFLDAMREPDALIYVEAEALESIAEKPRWYIAHSLDATVEPEGEVTAANGVYRLHSQYPHTALSGFSGYLYERADPLPSETEQSALQ